MSAITRTDRSSAKPSAPDRDPAYADYVALVSPFNGETCYFPPATADRKSVV